MKRNEDLHPNEVKQWREDLKASADLSGWNLKTTADGYIFFVYFNFHITIFH